jgi:precorrin-4 methylase
VLVAFALMIAARLVVGDRPRDAVVLQTKADDLLAAADYVLFEGDLAPREALLADAAARLGETGHRDAVDEGQTLDADAAADLAAEVLGAVGSAPSTKGRDET